MKKTEINAPQSRSWRDIPQQVKPRAMSSEGRRRLVFSGLKTAAAIVVVGGLGWGAFEIAAALRGKAPTKVVAEQAVPVKEVVLATDGVLDRKWLVRTLAIPKNATLMELDLYRLRARLLASGQVRAATLTQNFPATLSVTLAERSPVARVKGQLAAEEPRVLLVARDGTVFEGAGFDAAMVETLPWLDGLKLEARGEGFAPVAGMETIADLLAKAKLEAEHLYRTWKSVSLARLETDREIEVRAEGVGRIVFGTNEDFFRQLARLDALLDETRAHTDKPLREIDLAIGAQVPVAFEEPPVAPAAAGAKPATLRLTPSGAKGAPSIFPAPARKQKL